jgi:F0F1-type ATP synthase membrane subunit b/b'
MLKIDPSIILIIAIVWVLVLVLTRTVFNPIRRIMRDRESGIASDREAGEKAEQAYEDSLRKIEDDIKKARAAAYSIQDTLEKEAVKEKERMLSEVSRECRGQVDEARQELQKQVRDLKSDLKKESERLAEKIEEKLLS